MGASILLLKEDILMESIKFQNMRHKIHGKTDEEMETFLKPFETKYQSFKKLKATTKHYLAIIRYLFYMFDPGSDLLRDHMRLEDRKQEAGKLSGLLKIVDLSFLDRLFGNTHPEALDVIQTLLTEVYFDIHYREWHTLHNELDEYTSARWEKIEGTKRKRGKKGEEAVTEVTGHNKSTMETLTLKSKLREECQRIRELIEQLDVKLWGDNKDIKDIAYKSRFSNPESFSRAAKQIV